LGEAVAVFDEPEELLVPLVLEILVIPLSSEIIIRRRGGAHPRLAS
jgi:hypothetical protein